MAHTTEYLASDALEGRGIGTQGLELAADFIAREFQRLGLDTGRFQKTPYQRFEITTSAHPLRSSRLSLLPPENRTAQSGSPSKSIEILELTEDKDFRPLAIGGSGQFDLPLVFAGYGITAPEYGYDDYEGLDVQDKAVILLRHEPQQENPHSKFEGLDNSRHAALRSKVSNAFQHGAAAVFFCTDQLEIDRDLHQWRRRYQGAVDALTEAEAEFNKIKRPTAVERKTHRRDKTRMQTKIQHNKTQLEARQDPLLDFRYAGYVADRDIPVFHCLRAVVEPMVRASLGKDLASLERALDEGPTPHSRELTGWRVVGEVAIERQKTEVKNVVAVLEGEGVLSDEALVIGAHYDHLGRGGVGSASPKSQEIHNGADDNASGIAVLLEIVHRLTNSKVHLPRSIVFVAFTGEERGLLGSSQYIRQPLVPLEKTVAMLNLDMVGRLKDNALIVNGTGTAEQFPHWLDQANDVSGLVLTQVPGGLERSDHYNFYLKQIPVLHFFTGSHSDYHRPSDDFHLINVAGMQRISDLIATLAIKIAGAEKRPTYQAVKITQASDRPRSARPYFGSIPDFGQTGGGYALSGVAAESPAAEAGIRQGDVIVRLGQNKIGNLEDFDNALRKFEAGDRVPVVIRRGPSQLSLEVTLDPPR